MEPPSIPGRFTVTRAPLGYKNVHVTDELGRVNRTVEIDPERAHLVTWAFYRYAEGDPTLRTLLDELTDRGLTTRATPKWPSKPLNVTTLHKLLRNPYYKGEVHYRGAAYPGLQSRWSTPRPGRGCKTSSRRTTPPEPTSGPTSTTCGAASTAAAVDPGSW